MARVLLASAGAGVVVNGSNQLVPGATVFVYTTGTTSQVTIYVASSGGTTLSQPLTTDVAGRIPGYADGQQTVDFVVSFGTLTLPPQQVELPRADAIASLSGGVLPLDELPAHASTHGAGGSDPITPASINAVSSVFGRTSVIVAGNADYLAVASGGLTGAVAATRFVGGTASGAPASGTFAKGDFAIDQTGVVWICTTAGTPGTWANAGASAGVASFNSRTGAVSPGNADYLAVATGGLTGATAATRFVGATASGAPASGTFALGDWIVDQTGKMWVCTVAGTSGTWVQVGGGAVSHVVRTVHTWTVGGTLATASGSSDLVNYIPPFFVSLGSSETSVKAVKAMYVIGTGTSATVKLQKNGSDLTGFTALSVTTTNGSVTPTAQAVAEGDLLALIITAVTGAPGNLTFTLVLEHTFT